jgi:hypothetical protein
MISRRPEEANINWPNFYRKLMGLILSDSSGWVHKDKQEEEIRSDFTEKGLMVLPFILLDLFSLIQSMKFVWIMLKHPVFSSTYDCLASLSMSHTSRGSNKVIRAHFFKSRIWDKFRKINISS